MRITRSINLVVLQYGLRSGFERPELYEAGMRVDATAKGQAVTAQDAAVLLSLLNGGLGHWLQTYWAGRLLLAPGKSPARTYASKHPGTLTRAPAEVACGTDVGAMAQFLLTDVCPAIFDRHALQVVLLQLSMDPGQSCFAELRAPGIVGREEVRLGTAADAFDTWTNSSSKTKFALVRRDRRPCGDA